MKEKRKEKRKPKLADILKQAEEEDDKELAWEKIMKLYNKQEFKKQNCMKEIDNGLRELRKLKIGLKRMKSDLEEFTDNDDEENDSFFVTSYDSRSDGSEKRGSHSKKSVSVMKSKSIQKSPVIRTP